jgi:hypothetical protein
MNQRHTANATEPKSYRCAFRHSVHESVLSTGTLGRVDAGTVTRSALGVGMFTKVPELRKTVLVVVREPVLRTSFSRFIEQTGFAVVEVDCHKKAWTILEIQPEGYTPALGERIRRYDSRSRDGALVRGVRPRRRLHPARGRARRDDHRRLRRRSRFSRLSGGLALS